MSPSLERRLAQGVERVTDDSRTSLAKAIAEAEEASKQAKRLLDQVNADPTDLQTKKHILCLIDDASQLAEQMTTIRDLFLAQFESPPRSETAGPAEHDNESPEPEISATEDQQSPQVNVADSQQLLSQMRDAAGRVIDQHWNQAEQVPKVSDPSVPPSTSRRSSRFIGRRWQWWASK